MFEHGRETARPVRRLRNDLQIARVVECGAQPRSRERVILYEHDRLHLATFARTSGKESVKVLPPSGRGAYATVPS